MFQLPLIDPGNTAELNVWNKLLGLKVNNNKKSDRY